MKKILLLVIAALLLSCGARKTQTQVSESETKTELQEEAKAVIDTKTQTNTVAEVSEQTGTYTPIDNSKPIVIEFPSGKKTTVWNAKYETGNRESKTSTSEAAAVKSVTDHKIKAVQVAKQSEKQKATDRKEAVQWWWLLLLLLIPLYYWVRNQQYNS